MRIYKETGTSIKGEVTSGLLLSIFNPGSPLHDGAVILQNTLVEAAGCILPLTESEMITPDMGTRHRAALGLTEETDAIVIVVSEERGAIAAAEDGRFVNLDMDEMALRRFLNERLFVFKQPLVIFEHTFSCFKPIFQNLNVFFVLLD